MYILFNYLLNYCCALFTTKSTWIRCCLKYCSGSLLICGTLKTQNSIKAWVINTTDDIKTYQQRVERLLYSLELKSSK